MVKAIIYDWMDTLYDRGVGIFPDAERVLQGSKEKGYKLGLVSAAGIGIERRKKELRASGFESYFDAVFIGFTKDEHTYQKCMDSLGAIPSETIVVGDRADRDVKVGNALGCKTIWIENGKWVENKPNKETGQPTYKIHQIKEVLDII